MTTRAKSSHSGLPGAAPRPAGQKGLPSEALASTLEAQRKVRCGSPHNKGDAAAMKTILVPTSPHDLMPSALTTAWLAGQRFGAYLEGFALRPALTEYIPFDMVG